MGGSADLFAQRLRQEKQLAFKSQKYYGMGFLGILKVALFTLWRTSIEQWGKGYIRYLPSADKTAKSTFKRGLLFNIGYNFNHQISNCG